MSRATALPTSCPIPLAQYPMVTLAHGGGGALMRRLIEAMFLPAFNNPGLSARHDGAELVADGARLAFTTDSYVVKPIVFPGGDIGSLAVYGTVNDLAMCGARPRWLSAGLILEEGFSMETLWYIVRSMQAAAARAGVEIVTGDTKVVDRGQGDGIFINTAGVGVIEHAQQIGPAQVRAGDVVLLSGDLGRHGIAIMAVREGLAFDAPIESDSAPLADLVLDLLAAGIEIHCLRDLTRGGLASALCEIAQDGRVQIQLDEQDIPVQEEVRGACEILGFDPLYVANEGRFAAFVAPQDAPRALAILHGHPLGAAAAAIGTVSDGTPGLVAARNALGSSRIIEMLSGEQLPRIC